MPTDRDREQEQIRALHTVGAELVMGSLCVALVTVAVLWRAVDRAPLLGWAAVYTLHLATRWLDIVRAPRPSASRDVGTHRGQAARYRGWAALNGVLWGMTSWLFFVDDYSYFSLLMVVHAGFLAASLGVTAAWDLTAFVLFAGAATSCFATGTLVRGGADYAEHALILVIYPLVLYPFARRINRHHVEQIELRLAHEDLLVDVREQRDTAEGAVRDKSRFLASASHDLRQPVHALGLFVAALEPHLTHAEPRRLLHGITQVSASLGGLFEGLLELSKLDAGIVVDAPEHMRLEPLFVRLSEAYAPAAEARGTRLDVRPATEIVLRADPALLERILRNVVANAIDATSDGCVTLRADAHGDGNVSVTITDTGKGIPAAELENIFSEYHQLENPERDRQKGLGLGLAIVRRLARLMDIGIGIESVPDDGSTFTLRIPAGDPSLVRSAHPRVHADGCADLSVLVVDDESEILAGMQALLARWSCRSLLAGSGDEALALLQGGDVPDAIVADFRLRGGESGLDVIQRVRDELNLDIPALLVTGDTAPERLREAAGARVDLMHKPVEPERLREALNRFAAKAGQRSAAAVSPWSAG